MKSKQKHKPPSKHRSHASRPPWLRNADRVDSLDTIDVPEQLIMPAPVSFGPVPGAPEASSMAMIPYNAGALAAPMRPSSLPRATLTKRATAAARAKAAALKPEVVNPLNKAHLLGVAASAGGGVAASLAARELGDNLGEKNLAVGLTALGALV